MVLHGSCSYVWKWPKLHYTGSVFVSKLLVSIDKKQILREACGRWYHMGACWVGCSAYSLNSEVLPFFVLLGGVSYNSLCYSGPLEVHILARQDAIKVWRNLMGPTKVYHAQFTAPATIRGSFGLSDTRNAVHGSGKLGSQSVMYNSCSVLACYLIGTSFVFQILLSRLPERSGSSFQASVLTGGSLRKRSILRTVLSVCVQKNLFIA